MDRSKVAPQETQPIGPYSFEEFLEMARSFHSFPAPGLLLGGYMVQKAKAGLEPETLFEAVVETRKCLPDAVQLLTPCSTGNGWMRVIHLGRFALGLYDKYSGQGQRVRIVPERLQEWPEIRDWLFKKRPKHQQDTGQLLTQIGKAGEAYMTSEEVQVHPRLLGKHSGGEIGVCPVCGEAYPVQDGGICRGCQGESPYERTSFPVNPEPARAVPVEKAVGKHALHDMTEIIPEKSKSPALRAGERIGAADLCRLQKMGRTSVYIQENTPREQGWIHENEAALAFARRMAGSGIGFETPPHEGKINFRTKQEGLFVLDREKLERFNLLPEVICATRHSDIMLPAGKQVAGCRSLPLHLSRERLEQALTVLGEGPLFWVQEISPAKVGILVTGTEVSQGLIRDRFQPIISDKVEKLGCTVQSSRIVPDGKQAIAEGVRSMLQEGVDLVLTTAGLSVDPDDQTREGLREAGLDSELYGMPVLPGAMTLLGRIGRTRVVGVPACALFFATTSLDLLLPRVLAGREITRRDLAGLAEGGLCLGCKHCTFPKCPFGK
ncbi:MAG: trehalose-binding protein [Desulfohalobiaceae bacterium]|nr:trehalose-binding protein [Desulfohalobiaceae bacterium]